MKSKEELNIQSDANLNKYANLLNDAEYFPTLEESCKRMAKCGLIPVPNENTGCTKGDMLFEAGMQLLADIKQEIHDSKTDWEREWEEENAISGAKAEFEEAIVSQGGKNNDDSTVGQFLEDGVTPKDGRPPLTVEYLRSIGYDIDIS